MQERPEETLDESARLSSRSFLARASMLVLFGCVAFFPSLQGEFISDDHFLVEKNPFVHSFNNVPRFFSTETPIGFYRPVILLSYTVDHFFFGKSPTGYRLTNLLLHLLNAVLLLAIFQALFPKGRFATPAAILFVLHPAHAESVSWISGRTDVLATCLGLLSLLFTLSARTGNPWRVFFALFFLLLAFLSKEAALAMPLLFLLLLLIPGRRSRTMLPVLLGAFLLLVLFWGFRQGILGIRLPGDPQNPPSPGALFATGVKLYFLNLLKLAFPVSLSFGFEPSVAVRFGLDSLAHLLFILLLLLMGLSFARRNPLYAFALLWIFIAFLPFSGLAHLAETSAERFLYLPSAGWVLLLGVLLSPKGKGTPCRFLRPLRTSLFFLFFLLLFLRNFDWREEYTIQTDAARKSPQNPVALFNAGDACFKRGTGLLQRSEGEEGNARAEEYLRQAESFFQRSLNLVPNQWESLKALGNTYLYLKDYSRALSPFQQLLELDPFYREVQESLARIYLALNLPLEAGRAKQKERLLRSFQPFRGERVTPEEDPCTKILLLGIDSLSPDLLLPMVEAGELPAFKRLMERGCWGMLLSFPPYYSPALWTTIATGKRRDQHGITYYEMKAPDGKMVLVNSNFRRTAALWNMVGSFGKRAGFVGWWATWPAEEVRGFIVSDHVAHSRFKAWIPSKERPFFHEIYPPELSRSLEHLICLPNDISREEILSFGRFSEEELRELYSAEKPLIFHYPSILKFAFQTEKTYIRIAMDLLKREKPDLMAVYLEGIDPVGHCYWHFYEPDKFKGVSPEDARRLGGVIPNYYRYIDRVVEAFLLNAGSGSTVVIVSDHGMEASGTPAVPGRVGSGIHNERGFVLVAGPPAREGGKIENATILDVTPTILALLGLPVGLDMEGNVLTSVFQEDFLTRYPVRLIESYDQWLRTPSRNIVSPAEEKYRDLLRAMGYLR